MIISIVVETLRVSRSQEVIHTNILPSRSYDVECALLDGETLPKKTPAKYLF